MISSTTCTVNGPEISTVLPLDHSKGRRHVYNWGGGGGGGGKAFGRVEGTTTIDFSKGRRHLDGWRAPDP